MIEFITQRNIHRHCLVMGCELSKRESGPFGEYKKGKHDMLTTSEQSPDITKFYKYKQVFLSRSCPNYKELQLYTLKFLRTWHFTVGNYAKITWQIRWGNLISFVVVRWCHLTMTTSSKMRNICFKETSYIARDNPLLIYKFYNLNTPHKRWTSQPFPFLFFSRWFYVLITSLCTRNKVPL